MKTLQEQYTKILKGEGRKDLFLKEAKQKYPNLISNLTSFQDAETILKNKSVINEELGGVVSLQPITQLTSEDFNPNKQAWENKFEDYLAEEKAKSLKPVINDEEKVNTKEQDEKIKAEAKKVDGTVENVEKRNYDYSPKVDNINNVNAQEMMNGVYYECKNDPSLSLEEAQEKVIKNLAKDELHYVKEGQFGVGIGYTEPEVQENTGKTYGGSGYSDKLKSDQGTQFESRLFQEICTLLGFRPQSDGQSERNIKTLSRMVAMSADDQADWDEHLPFISMAYRATPQTSTGLSPNFMMYGREISMPVDIMIGAPIDEPSSELEYVKNLQLKLNQAYKLARLNLKSSAERQ